MLTSGDMTDFQTVWRGFRIFDAYLTPKDNPGWIVAQGDEIHVGGVHRDALGGDDLVKLEAMGWQWNDEHQHWWIEP